MVIKMLGLPPSPHFFCRNEKMTVALFYDFDSGRIVNKDTIIWLIAELSHPMGTRVQEASYQSLWCEVLFLKSFEYFRKGGTFTAPEASHLQKYLHRDFRTFEENLSSLVHCVVSDSILQQPSLVYRSGLQFLLDILPNPELFYLDEDLIYTLSEFDRLIEGLGSPDAPWKKIDLSGIPKSHRWWGNNDWHNAKPSVE